MGPNGPAVWADFMADGPKSAQESAHKKKLKTRAISAKTNPMGRLGRFWEGESTESAISQNSIRYSRETGSMRARYR